MKHWALAFLISIKTCLSFAQTGPLAVDDYVTVTGNINTPLNVLGNDVDPGGGPLQVALLIQPQHGTVTTLANQLYYKRNLPFTGADSLTYRVCDTLGLCATATVFITVVHPNTPSIAAADNFVLADTATNVVLNVLANDATNSFLQLLEVLNIDSENLIGSIRKDSTNNLAIFVHTQYACGSGNFAYIVCDTLQCDTGQITISIECPANIKLPEGFSPNGDGKNDFLVFKDLEFFAPAALKVFNRYGFVVYENTDYRNNWDGTTANGSALPDGTYFYILQPVNGHTYNNYLVIHR